MKLRIALLVGAGGALGSSLRFGLAESIPSTQFPWATLIANLIGCFIIALLVRGKNHLSTNFAAFAMKGFCGALTTLSLFSLELVLFIQAGEWTAAFLYFILSLGLCLPLLFAIIHFKPKGIL